MTYISCYWLQYYSDVLHNVFIISYDCGSSHELLIKKNGEHCLNIFFRSPLYGRYRCRCRSRLRMELIGWMFNHTNRLMFSWISNNIDMWYKLEVWNENIKQQSWWKQLDHQKCVQVKCESSSHFSGWKNTNYS